MAAKKKNVRKSTKKKSSGSPNYGLLFVIIFLIAVGIGIIAFLYHDKIIDKAKNFSDNTSDADFTYPVDYEKEVVKYSKKYKVDSTLVYSVIYVESKFNPKAVSDVGARGLMQLMPDAYDWIKFRLSDKSSKSFDDMYKPAKNIQYGAYYLSYLMKKYNGSIDLTAAAYHCGMGTVDKWISDKTINPNSVDTDKIPDENDATAYYIEKIRTAYTGYKKSLSSNEDLSANK